jgi:mRNA interferase MazF
MASVGDVSLPDVPLRWAIVLVDFDPSVGHEQAGTRRALVVSYEAFHRSGMASVCPITSRRPKYPGEVQIPMGRAGQTRNGLVLCHQVRTVDLGRITAWEIGGRIQQVTEPGIRANVRAALAHQLGLDIRSELDGAA